MKNLTELIWVGEQGLEAADERFHLGFFLPFLGLWIMISTFKTSFSACLNLQLNLFFSIVVASIFIWRIKWNRFNVLSTTFRSVTYRWQRMRILHRIVDKIKKKLKGEQNSHRIKHYSPFSVSISISRQNKCKEVVKHYQMKAVEFWRRQGYSLTKISYRMLTSWGQPIASTEKMRKRLIKKAILSRNFFLGNLKRYLEELFCTDYPGSPEETCFCKTQFLLLKTASDAVYCVNYQRVWPSLRSTVHWKCSNVYVSKWKKSSNSKYRLK